MKDYQGFWYKVDDKIFRMTKLQRHSGILSNNKKNWNDVIVVRFFNKQQKLKNKNQKDYEQNLGQVCIPEY